MNDRTLLDAAPVEVNADGTRYWLVLPDAATDYIQGLLAREHRPYEPELLSDMRQRVSPGDLFVDVGANVGNHALYMACVAGCRVAAFEPNASLCDAMRASAALNDVSDRVQIHVQGVGRTSGKARFEAELPANLGAQRLLLDSGDIEVVALDTIELGAPVRMLKIDVEGMEADVLDGAIELLRRHRPLIYVECIRERDFREVARRLDALGYCYWETFNATPTHLFLPAEAAQVERRIGRLQNKQVEGEYRLGVLNKQLRTHLGQTTERETALRVLVDQLRKDGDQQLDGLRTDLLADFERHGEQQLTGMLSGLERHSEQQLTVLSSLEHRSEQQLTVLSSLEHRSEQQLTGVLSSLERHGEQQLTLLNKLERQGEQQLTVLNSLGRQGEQQLTGVLNSLERHSEQQLTVLNSLERQGEQQLTGVLNSLERHSERQLAALEALRADTRRWQEEAERLRDEAQARAQVLGQLQRQLSTEQTRAKALADERQRLQRTLESLAVRTETAERNRTEALERLRAGVTFRTGDALIQAGKSPRALFQLPATLWRIARDNKARRAAKGSARPKTQLDATRAPAAPSALLTAPSQHPAPAPASIAKSAPGTFANLRQLRVAVVGSAEIAAAFASECQVVDPSAEGDTAPQILLLDASATRSSHWATAEGRPVPALATLIERCRARNIPSLLWLHEIAAVDPGHLPWASLVDHVFVADLDALSEWQAALRHDRVHLLPSAVASSRVNPLQRGPEEDAFGELALGPHDPQSVSDLPIAALEAIARHGVAVSPYSHALRLMFGRLLVVSDNAGERQRRVTERRNDPIQERRLRAAALRKVHEEHSFRHRLATIALRLAGSTAATAKPQQPQVCAVAMPRDQAELDEVIASHRRQLQPAALLLVVAPPDRLQVPDAPDLRRVGTLREAAVLAAKFDAVAPLSARDYHGPRYLSDLLIASQWAAGAVVTRGPLFRAQAGGRIELDDAAAPYQRASRAALRSSLVPATLWAQRAGSGECAIDDATIDGTEVITIDAFGYCVDANAHGAGIQALADQVHGDIAAGTDGISLARLEAMAPAFAPTADNIEPALAFTPREWLAFLPEAPEQITFTVDGDRVVVESRLEPAAFRYLYFADSYPATRLGTGERICGLDGEADRSVLFVLVFFDAQRKKLGHVMHAPGKQLPLTLPPGTASVKVALRIEGSGRASLGRLTVSAPRPAPRPVVGSTSHLLITKQYPGYDDLYRFAFVHSRVRAYLREGGTVDVLRVGPEPGRKHREFENVDVTEADLAHLDASLALGVYDSLLVHFMDPPIWRILLRHLDKVRVTVWVHGADVQPWWRRAGNYQQPAQRDKARSVTDERLATWRELFALDHPNLRVVFVSRQQADETLCDLGLDPDRPGVEVIHNFIDGDLFAYREKPAEQRLRILSIRPYASAVYANDLAAQAILQLATRPIFAQLHFRLIGDGVLWEETVAPLRGLPNVELTRGFVTQREIAELHREYGVFLVPSRMDSQGVSRDEAMASGLVPVTTRVAAIPEFVDDDCAMLCPPENPAALAAAIEALATDPARFAVLSKAAAARVRRQSGREQTIGRELALVARSAPSAPPLRRFDRRIAVYGDLNLNIVDGSAIWAASLAETLSGLPRTQVCLLLKARIQRTTVISRLLGLAPEVQIVEPSLRPQQAMEPAAAVQRLVELDAERPFRAFVLRGLNLCTCAAATPQLRGRIWAYLTDVPQSADALDTQTRERIEAVAEACEFLLCQTPQMEAYLLSLFPSVRGRTRLLPPMVPTASADPSPRSISTGPLRLCYAGKFAPNWGITELADVFGELRRSEQPAELHIYGDKIHQVPQDPEFHPRTAKWLADTPGLVWHGAVDRDTLMRELPAMDLCWAYRDPRFEHGTLELSTKLLEYASLGVPVVVTRSPVNESVLGVDYPLFVDSVAQAQALLELITQDRSLLALASERLKSVVSGYSFEAVRDRLVAQGLG